MATTDPTESNVPEPGSTRAARWRSARQANGNRSSSGNAVYALGMLGALVYFARPADSPKAYLRAVAMATIWPALLVYRALERLET